MGAKPDPKKVFRLLDANVNRAREGLRVVEDTARFVWNDKSLYTRARRLRHQLHEITASRYKELLKHRDSEIDAGRTLAESSRKDWGAVVAANIRRAEEAARVLEEYSKVLKPNAAAELKAIRYSLYAIEKGLLKHL